jgi:hypothetical protein
LPWIGCPRAGRARPGQAPCIGGVSDRRRGWWRLTRAGESGREVGGVHGALGVGRRFADRVAAGEEAPVIHSVARGGPGCRAVLGGSIKWAAVLLGLVEKARHRSELARACTSRPDAARESGVSWRGSRGFRQFLEVVGVRLVFEAADLAVAEPVVAEGEDLAGDRDLGDVSPAPFGDPLELSAQRPAPGEGCVARLRSAPSGAPASLDGRCARDVLCRRSCARSAPGQPRRIDAGRSGTA